MNWVLELRTEFWSNVFKWFPLLASDYFYITIIALGYWLSHSRVHQVRSSESLFRSLGFLVPFATLLNCLLKNCFKIPRPDATLHLITVHDKFGFPSGDVQVAVIFWGCIMLGLKSKLKYLCLIPVIGIAISRVYLGVHSIYDVAGGAVIGLIIIYLWKKYLENYLFKNHTRSAKRYWSLLVASVLIYALVSQNLTWPPMVAIAIGALTGFGISWKFLLSKGEFTERSEHGQNVTKFQNKYGAISLPRALLSLGVIIIMALTIPIMKENELLLNLTLILKYSIITFSIFYLIPKANELRKID